MPDEKDSPYPTTCHIKDASICIVAAIKNSRSSAVSNDPTKACDRVVLP